MSLTCAGKSILDNKIYIHPLYFIKVVKNKDKNKGDNYICPTSFYIENDEIKLEKISTKENEYQLNFNDFDIDVFLLTVYNIRTIQDGILWTRNNFSEHQVTIYRVLNLVWDSKLKKEHLEDYDIIDELVNLYIELFLLKEDLKIEYKDMYEAISKTINTFSGSNLSQDITRSYQQEIKNLLQII